MIFFIKNKKNALTKTIFFLYKNTPLSCSEERLVNSEDEEESALLVYKVMN